MVHIPIYFPLCYPPCLQHLGGFPDAVNQSSSHGADPWWSGFSKGLQFLAQQKVYFMSPFNKREMIEMIEMIEVYHDFPRKIGLWLRIWRQEKYWWENHRPYGIQLGIESTKMGQETMSAFKKRVQGESSWGFVQYLLGYTGIYGRGIEKLLINQWCLGWFSQGFLLNLQGRSSEVPYEGDQIPKTRILILI